MHAPILLRCKHIFCEECVSEWSYFQLQSLYADEDYSFLNPYFLSYYCSMRLDVNLIIYPLIECSILATVKQIFTKLYLALL